MQVVFSDEERKKYKAPWYRTIFRMRLWRCPKVRIPLMPINDSRRSRSLIPFDPDHGFQSKPIKPERSDA